MQENGSLWKKITVSIYGITLHGWRTRDFKRKKGNRPWVDIASNFPLFSRFVRFKVEEGKKYLLLGGTVG